MEVNKDEALRCLQIAQQCRRSGNLPRAKKFIDKSLKLYPTEQGRRLKEEVEAEGTEPGSSTAAPTTEEGVRQRRAPNAKPSSTTGNGPTQAGTSGRPYTQEQAEGVAR